MGLEDMRSRQKFRREVLRELDELKECIASGSSGTALLTTSEFKRIVVKVGPWVLTALTTAFHIVRTVYHF